MKVYRFMCEEELNMILNNKTEKLGKYWNNSAGNNHRYKKNKKYIHFFAKEQSIKYIVQTRKLFEKELPEISYICEFDIPIIHLLCHYGEGKYLELKGYEYVNVGEFAIRADKFKCNWLTKFKKMETKKDGEKVL